MYDGPVDIVALCCLANILLKCKVKSDTDAKQGHARNARTLSTGHVFFSDYVVILK